MLQLDKQLPENHLPGFGDLLTAAFAGFLLLALASVPLGVLGIILYLFFGS